MLKKWEDSSIVQKILYFPSLLFYFILFYFIFLKKKNVFWKFEHKLGDLMINL